MPCPLNKQTPQNQQSSQRATTTSEGHLKPAGRMRRFVRLFHNPLTAWIILGLSFIVTIAAYNISNNFVKQRAEDRFEFRTKEIKHAIAERLRIYEQQLWSGVGFMYASENVDRNEFAKFVETMGIGKHWPGIQGFGFSVLVPAEEKNAHIQSVRAEGFPKFTIKPEGERELYSSIIYLEPFNWRNQRAFGYDMWSNPMRRAAMQRARDQGVAATSGIITLVQETEEAVQKGFLTYVPVYTTRNIPETVEERRKYFKGWVYAPYRAGDLMQGIIGFNDANIEFEIYDGETMHADALLYDTNDSPHLTEVGHNPAFSKTVQVTNQGRVWTLHFNTPQNYLTPAERNQPRFIALAGLIVEALLFYIIWSIYFLNKRAERMAEKRAKELMETEGRMQAVLNNTVDGVVTIDDQGLIETFNKACEDIFGYSEAEVLGKNVKMLMPEPYQAEHDQYLNNYKETEEKQIIGIGREVEAMRKDGSTFPVELSISEIVLGSRTIFSGIIRDITERKAADVALNEERNFYRAILDNSPDLIFVKDDKLNIIEANERFLSMYNVPAEEILGTTTLEKFPPEEAKAFKERDLAVLKENKIIEAEEPVTEASGMMHIWNTKKIPFNSETRGHVLLGISRDVTERKKTEEERERLIAALADHNEELERFAFIASHDLKEPLRMVSNFTEMLKEDYGDRLTEPDAQKALKYITEGAQNMNTLVGDLLEYARTGHEDTARVFFETKEVLKTVLENLKDPIERTQTEVELPSVLPPMRGNRTRFVQLMQNLLSNAIKYQIAGKKPIININIEDKDTYWQISVKDNGIGIRKEYQGKIFEPFQRLHGSSEYEGTGIGLAICRRIAEKEGGSLWVESEPGEGSTFYFTFKK